MTGTSVGFVGTVGGAGTTRSLLEIGGLLARNGDEVLLFDLDFATQGLGHHVEGSIPVDSATLLADPEHDLEDAVQDWAIDGAGSLGVIPAMSPFVRIAEAKTEAAGARVTERLAEATERADWVLLDVPPVVSNQAIGAVTAADRTIAVLPPTNRGVDGLQRERGRLADVGTAFEGVLAVGAGDVPPDADAHLPPIPDGAPAHRPTTLQGRNSFLGSVAQATNTLLSTTVERPETDSALDRLEALGDRLRP